MNLLKILLLVGVAQALGQDCSFKYNSDQDATTITCVHVQEGAQVDISAFDQDCSFVYNAKLKLTKITCIHEQEGSNVDIRQFAKTSTEEDVVSLSSDRHVGSGYSEPEDLVDNHTYEGDGGIEYGFHNYTGGAGSYTLNTDPEGYPCFFDDPVELEDKSEHIKGDIFIFIITILCKKIGWDNIFWSIPKVMYLFLSLGFFLYVIYITIRLFLSQEEVAPPPEPERGGNVDARLECSICLNTQRSVALVPCGHTFCSTCTQEFNGECPVCRQAFDQTQRLYF